ncbi:MAG: divergent PAP2 family protein [Clostridiales bacterium]|jgi:acid phosphatase family membrane protein YuiD|nr:divergent PAP2 family protein [Eubacteriales bacterium]MDH7565227.1 divergent PAP2 family protein [Clostridiales bacterium]
MLLNKTVVVPALSFLIAQTLKVLTVIAFQKKFDFRRFIGSGGMPSSHSAFIVSLATVVGKTYGLKSGLFGVSMAVAIIVMYDAAGVRRAAGKQAKVLNKLICSMDDKTRFDENLKELIGHTPFEVLIGAILGVAVGLLFS